jgi:RNA polymerase sigma factor (sigma-70 family)
MTIADSLRHLGLSAPDPHPDGELVERFARARDEGAFAELLRRHGPTVLGVCRRVLGNAPDADDAFQAVFLVLARKVGTIRPPGMVGNWLYGVAVRTANKARVMNAKRRAREQASRERERSEHAPGSPDTLAVIDAELAALPEQYRTAFVACELNGRSRAEAARDLGWPEGTVATRLAKARELLAGRLRKRGVTLGVGLLAAVAVQPATASETLAAVRELLAVGTATAVAPAAQQLSDEVVKAMNLFSAKWVLSVGVLAVGLAAGGAVLLAGPGDRPVREPINAPVPKDTTQGWTEGKPIELEDGGRITGVAYSSDGKFIAIAQDKRLEVLHADTRKRHFAIEFSEAGTIRAVAFSPKGDKLAVTRKDDVLIRTLDVKDPGETWEVKGLDPHRVAWVGEVLVTSNGAETWFRTADGKNSGYRGWADHKHKPTVLAAGGSALAFVFNNEPDGNPDPFDLFVMTPDARPFPQTTRRVSGHKARPTSATLSTDGKRVVTADEGGTLIVWEGEEFKEKSRVELGDGVAQLALAPDGKTLAVLTCKVRIDAGLSGVKPMPTEYHDWTLGIYDLTDLSEKAKPLYSWKHSFFNPAKGETPGPASLAVSPDGKTLLAAFADPHPAADNPKERGLVPRSMGVKVWELVPKK